MLEHLLPISYSPGEYECLEALVTREKVDDEPEL